MTGYAKTVSGSRFNRPALIISVVLAVFLGVLILFSAGQGYIKIPFSEVFKIIGSKLAGAASLTEGIPTLKQVVILEVRLPRILTATSVGAGLAVSGVVFQGLLLNPLADPYTLGVSAGAAFGACVAILFNTVISSLLVPIYSIPVFAFTGAIGTLFFVVYLSASGGGLSSNNLILSGIIVSAILSAGISLLKYLADEKVSVIIFWLLGSFVSRTWYDVILTLSVVVVGFLIMGYYARDLNLISLGERSAGTLGVNTGRVRLILLITASLIAAVCVSVSGIIGFVGLLVPHMIRMITGPDNRILLPVSVLTGAILLLGADTLIRAALPGEIPIGVLTALIGGPFFCYIFRKSHMGKRVSG